MLNPKSLLFYVAFFPQFITPDLPIGPQLAVLSASFLIIALAIDSLYAVLAGRLNRVFSNQRWARLRNRVLGTVLMATGAGLAAILRRSTSGDWRAGLSLLRAAVAISGHNVRLNLRALADASAAGHSAAQKMQAEATTLEQMCGDRCRVLESLC